MPRCTPRGQPHRGTERRWTLLALPDGCRPGGDASYCMGPRLSRRRDLGSLHEPGLQQTPGCSEAEVLPARPTHLASLTVPAMPRLSRLPNPARLCHALLLSLSGGRRGRPKSPRSQGRGLGRHSGGWGCDSPGVWLWYPRGDGVRARASPGLAFDVCPGGVQTIPGVLDPQLPPSLLQHHRGPPGSSCRYLHGCWCGDRASPRPGSGCPLHRRREANSSRGGEGGDGHNPPVA